MASSSSHGFWFFQNTVQASAGQNIPPSVNNSSPKNRGRKKGYKKNGTGSSSQGSRRSSKNTSSSSQNNSRTANMMSGLVSDPSKNYLGSKNHFENANITNMMSGFVSDASKNHQGSKNYSGNANIANTMSGIVFDTSKYHQGSKNHSGNANIADMMSGLVSDIPNNHSGTVEMVGELGFNTSKNHYGTTELVSGLASDVEMMSELTSNTSQNNSGIADMMSGLASNREQEKLQIGQIIGNKRVHFIFDPWTAEEKAIMDQELEKRASLPKFKICQWVAILLPHKSIRDISRRIDNLVKHGILDENLRKIRNDRQVNGSDLVHQLLQKNAQTLGQICSNLQANKISDNIELFRQSWKDIETILNDFKINPGNGIMESMPPVPVEINKELFHLVLPETESAKGTLNPDSQPFPMAANEDTGNSALCPINVLEETVFPIQTTLMQSPTVGRMDEELSKVSVMPENNWEEPFNQNITTAVPPSPGGDLGDYDFFLPDNPNDPDFMIIQKMLSAQAAEDSRR